VRPPPWASSRSLGSKAEDPILTRHRLKFGRATDSWSVFLSSSLSGNHLRSCPIHTLQPSRWLPTARALPPRGTTQSSSVARHHPSTRWKSNPAPAAADPLPPRTTRAPRCRSRIMASTRRSRARTLARYVLGRNPRETGGPLLLCGTAIGRRWPSWSPSCSLPRP
jgi:hypothetical protein